MSALALNYSAKVIEPGGTVQTPGFGPVAEPGTEIDPTGSVNLDTASTQALSDLIVAAVQKAMGTTPEPVDYSKATAEELSVVPPQVLTQALTLALTPKS